MKAHTLASFVASQSRLVPYPLVLASVDPMTSARRINSELQGLPEAARQILCTEGTTIVPLRTLRDADALIERLNHDRVDGSPSDARVTIFFNGEPHLTWSTSRSVLRHAVAASA